MAAQSTFDGQMLVVWSGRDVRIWRLSGTDEKQTLAGHGHGVAGAAYSRDGKWLASVHKDQTVRIWDVTTGRPIRTFDLAGPGQAVSFSPDGDLMATSDYSKGTVWIWDPQSGNRLLEVENDCGPRVWSIGFSPDGRHLAAGGSGGVEVWRR